MFTEVGNGSQRQTAGGILVDSIDCGFPSNVTAGNLLIVAGAVWRSPSITDISVTDTLGTAYTVLLSPTGVPYLAPGDGAKQFIAYGIAPTSGPCTVTVDPTGTDNWINFAIDEFTGVDAAVPLDVDGGESTGNGTTASDSLTTLTDGALVIASAASDYITVPNDTINNWTASSGYTLFGFENPNSIQTYAVEFGIVGAAGFQTVDMVVDDVSKNWSIITAAFKPLLVPPVESIHFLDNSEPFLDEPKPFLDEIGIFIQRGFLG